MERTIIQCGNCEKVYTARVREEGTIILPTSDQHCECGHEVFDEVGGRRRALQVGQ